MTKLAREDESVLYDRRGMTLGQLHKSRNLSQFHAGPQYSLVRGDDGNMGCVAEDATPKDEIGPSEEIWRVPA
jgi:hypothetical protein